MLWIFQLREPIKSRVVHVNNLATPQFVLIEDLLNFNPYVTA